MKNNKQIKKEGIFSLADRFVSNFFNGLSTGAANTIIKKAEKAGIPPHLVNDMKEIEKMTREFEEKIKKLK
jgi:hypothetical protein